MKMHILITGGLGFIGSHTATILIANGHEITILDNLENSFEDTLDKIAQITDIRPRFLRVDIRDECALLEALRLCARIDVCIHFAADKSVSESQQYPLKYFRNNVIGTINLLECLHIIGCFKFVFSSSAAVYSESIISSRIDNPYACSKLVIEEILSSYASVDTRISIVVLRYFNPIGAHPSGILGESPRKTSQNLLPMLLKAAQNSTPFVIFGNNYDTPDGTCIRDYIHVMDVAEVHVSALERLAAGYKMFNVGLGDGTSVLEMVRLVEIVTGFEVQIEWGLRRIGDISRSRADLASCADILQFRPRYSVFDAIVDAYKFITKNVIKL